MVILKTLVGSLAANVNEITFTDAIINSNSIIEVYYNSNDIYTVETWQRENTIGIVTSDHDFPVSVKILINNVVAFEPYDDTSLVNRIDGLADRMTDAEEAIIGLSGRVGDVEDDIDALETSKQDVLTAGDNIIIENNVISARSSSFLETVLHTNYSYNSASGTSNVIKTYTLNDSIDNFDAVIVYAYLYNQSDSVRNVQSNLMSFIVFKNDIYDTAYDAGQPADNPFFINASSDTARRCLAFQFTDSTHIRTVAIRTEPGLEPVLYKVVGLHF